MQEILLELEQSIDDFHLSKFEKKVITAKFISKNTNGEDLKTIREQAYLLALNRIEDKKSKHVIKWLEEINNIIDQFENQSIAYCKSYFSPGLDCLDAIVKQIRNSTSKIDICVFTISDNRIRDEITEAINRGIKVRIISDDDKTLDKGSDIDYLANKGADVKIDCSPSHMHHKFAIFDNARLLTGSYNWTRSASEFNQENILETNNPEAIISYQKEFERLWNTMYEL